MERAGCGGVGGRLLVSVLGICACAGVGGLGGTLLGPEESGAEGLDGFSCAGFLWLFGCWIVDASIFVAVLLKAFRPSFLGWVGCLVFVVFVCVATSYEGRMVDALASRADEGRRSLR